MLSENELMKTATEELIRVFGRKYLQQNYQNTCRSFGIINDSVFQLFVGIKGKKDLPNRNTNEKGWVVYGKVLLDAKNGNIINTEYVLE